MKSKSKGCAAVALYHASQPFDLKKTATSRLRSKSPLMKESLTPDRATRKKAKVTPKKASDTEQASVKEAMRKLMQNYQSDLTKFEAHEHESKARERELVKENLELREQLKLMRKAVGDIKKGQKEINEERFMLMKEAEKKQRCYENLSQHYKGTVGAFIDEITTMLTASSPTGAFAKSRTRLMKKLRETEAQVGLNLQYEMQSLINLGGTNQTRITLDASYEHIENLQSFCNEPKEWDFDITADCTGRSEEQLSYFSTNSRCLP
mmetsp:Transcript_21051/g.38956  ORF Transcript_21051/g.38956 Transcript_21051/m.38956 type:complete len:265 (-) Transcript_21051:28-822(-)